jgi:hypothetical protein
VTSEGIVQVRSIFLSRFFIRCIEVAGAGVVSALCAYFLSQIQLGKPAAAPQPLAQAAQVSTVNQLALAAGESVRVVEEVPAPRVEAALAEPQPQKEEPPKKPESTAAPPATPAPAATAPAPAPKPAKPAQTAQPRREAKPRAAEPVQPPVAAAPLPVAPPAQTADAAPAAAKSAEDDRPLFERLKLVPSWFSAKNDKPSDKPAADKPAADKPLERPVAEVPRPPMPVGDSLQSAVSGAISSVQRLLP